MFVSGLLLTEKTIAGLVDNSLAGQSIVVGEGILTKTGAKMRFDGRTWSMFGYNPSGRDVQSMLDEFGDVIKVVCKSCGTRHPHNRKCGCEDTIY